MISHRPITDPGPSEKDRWKWRTFEGPQHDPTRLAAKAGIQHYARRSIKSDGSRVLMPDDFMPFGPHAGQHLRAVPRAYLDWIDRQPWADRWPHWQPLRDYLARFPTENREPRTANILIYVDPIHIDPAATKTFRHGASRLHVAKEEHLPYLHAFALGACGLFYQWFRDKDPGYPPHYLLTPAGQKQALDDGAELITRLQMDQHTYAWRGKPKFQRHMPDGTTQCTKHCYADLKEAQTAINAIMQRHRRNRPEHLRAYLCPDCGFHHLTKQP